MLETLWEKRKGKLGRYCVIAISISRKNGQEGRKGGRKEGLHAIRETPSILDRRKMARCDEKAREESRQLSRVIDRREIRPEISRSLSRFFSPSSRIPSRLSSSRYCNSNLQRGKRKDIAIGIIYYCFAINGGRVRVPTILRNGEGGREGRRNKKRERKEKGR